MVKSDAKKTYFNWSSGKDSAMALFELLQDKSYDVSYLLTSVNAVLDRVTMHGVRAELLDKQLEAIGIPSGKVLLPEHPTNLEYEKLMAQKVSELKQDGFTHAAFGDIFLEDLRIYRETQLASFGIETVFPIWGRNTKDLMRNFVQSGCKAIVVCADASKLDKVGSEKQSMPILSIRFPKMSMLAAKMVNSIRFVSTLRFLRIQSLFRLGKSFIANMNPKVANPDSGFVTCFRPKKSEINQR